MHNARSRRLIDADALIAVYRAEIEECRNELAEPDTDLQVITLLWAMAHAEAMARKGEDRAA